MKCMKITHQGDTSSLHLAFVGVKPTFKYTRIDVRHALGYPAAGRTPSRWHRHMKFRSRLSKKRSNYL